MKWIDAFWKNTLLKKYSMHTGNGQELQARYSHIIAVAMRYPNLMAEPRRLQFVAVFCSPP
jgi:hypothetical protein